MKLFEQMNQKLMIGGLKRQFGRFWLLIGLIMTVLSLLYIGYWFGDSALTQRQLLIAEQQQRLDELYTQTDEQLQQINFLRVEMEIERQAAEHVQQQLLQTHKDKHQLSKELSFYQKIMAPELQAGGLEIDEFSIEMTPAEHIFHYKLVLVQTQKTKRFAKGFVQMIFSGVEGNNAQQYGIGQLRADKQQKLPFSFQYFQILEGDIVLPDKFSAQNVNIAVILPAGKWQKYEQLDRQYPFEVLTE